MKCPICTEKYSTNSGTICLRCGLRLCLNCTLSLKEKNCPYCRCDQLTQIGKSPIHCPSIHTPLTSRELERMTEELRASTDALAVHMAKHHGNVAIATHTAVQLGKSHSDPETASNPNDSAHTSLTSKDFERMTEELRASTDALAVHMANK